MNDEQKKVFLENTARNMEGVEEFIKIRHIGKLLQSRSRLWQGCGWCLRNHIRKSWNKIKKNLKFIATVYIWKNRKNHQRFSLFFVLIRYTIRFRISISLYSVLDCSNRATSKLLKRTLWRYFTRLEYHFSENERVKNCNNENIMVIPQLGDRVTWKRMACAR